MSNVLSLERLLAAGSPAVVSGAPEGLDALFVARLARAMLQETADKPAAVMHVARDDKRLAAMEAALGFFDAKLKLAVVPAWDSVPFDRVAPNAEIAGRRIASLTRLAARQKQGSEQATVVLTTVNALLQRVPSRDFMRAAVARLKPGERLPLEGLALRLEAYGYARSANVMEPGEYAIRGGICDLYPPGRSRPVRLDFFGDELESIRVFDPDTQRSLKQLGELVLLPFSEVAFDTAARTRFRQNYVERFGAVTSADPLYEAVSAGSRYQGMEHWLPLFHERLETLFDYAPGAVLVFDHLVEDARRDRAAQIADHYESRQAALEQKSFGAPPYKPVAPSEMFLIGEDWDKAVGERRVYALTPFEAPGDGSLSLEGRQGRSFAAERAQEGVNVFDAVVAHVRARLEQQRRVIVACWSAGARERLKSLLEDHGLEQTEAVETLAQAEALGAGITGLAVLGLETGFEGAGLTVVAEQDILGDKLIRRRPSRKGSDILTEAASLSAGDLVVHAEHGIARFAGLKTIEAAGAPHDCLELVYQGNDRLYLPVENIELLSRYGSDEAGAVLDRLGGSAWQSRKAKLKKRLREIAGELIKIAAMRQLREAPVMPAPEGLYEEFCARFPYEETEDQASSIAAVLDDLSSGRPMDRLICGDVGFGKTEVALRSTLLAAMAGKQVAVVVPTTLLARQHYQTFQERFRGLPVRLAQASRLVGAKELAEVKAGLKSGDVDIAIGTHALLGKSIEFRNLGLLIIDEEQHFGVQHKERLKALREDVHVLTLTATPIPRTLQMALTGVRELSLISTPPVDRLAVRTYVTPFDPMILREALMRERFRGGQSFYVVPRIADLDEAGAFLAEHVPELKVARAHGQLAPGQIEDVMNAFYDRQYDVLLSTAIIESGLDIPTANTLIVHRSDRFGLAQLYQLRGRVGRSKTRAYAYFTLPAELKLTPAAERRLKVLQSLDTLGAGFSLASHDMDIRGAGNLLGEEQSGHIREVGFELYQSMLEETVAQLRGQDIGESEEQWSPRIALGAAVLIPEAYVPDLQVRLGLYRRLSSIAEDADVESFAGEMVDRFGPLPEEVEHLLEIVRIKAACRRAGIAEIDAGPRGALVGFRGNSFANPEALIAMITDKSGRVKLQPDHKLVIRGDWDKAQDRLRGVLALARQLAELAEKGKKAA
ncbi:MAG: transcription-repair coupling factor [Pseudomonadota bacterium]|nr:transcription-repair coupling factor [Pseudomonadota bacterium]